jgi:hypothetical protein
MLKKNTSPLPPGLSSMVMKVVKNCSLQGRSVILNEEGVFKTVWLAPKESITVPESQVTKQIINLHKRRLVTIGN